MMSEASSPPKRGAEHILELRKDQSIETMPMHILKLVYLCHGWMLGNTNEELIDEPVEAWQYGPVVPSIYHTYKSFGGDDIDIVIRDVSQKFGDYQKKLIERVVDAYKGHSALSLSSITHENGSPWHQVFKDGARGRGDHSQ